MNIVLARTFLEIVECGNFNKAAVRLNVTQSTVTMRINALEDIVGQKLFLRNRTGATLTSAGSKLRRYATLMVQIWQQAQQEIALPRDFTAAINIGIDPHLWEGPGRDWVIWLRQSMPKVALSVHAGDSRSLLTGLSHGLLDIALTYTAQSGPGVQVRHLFDERLILVSKTRRERVRWHPLYVYVDWGDEFRRAHSVAFPDEQTPGTTIGRADWALRYILDAGGSGYFPQRMIEALLAQKRLFEVPDATQFQRAVFVEYSEKSLATEWFRKAISELEQICAAYQARPARAKARIHVF